MIHAARLGMPPRRADHGPPLRYTAPRSPLPYTDGQGHSRPRATRRGPYNRAPGASPVGASPRLLPAAALLGDDRSAPMGERHLFWVIPRGGSSLSPRRRAPPRLAIRSRRARVTCVTSDQNRSLALPICAAVAEWHQFAAISRVVLLGLRFPGTLHLIMHFLKEGIELFLGYADITGTEADRDVVAATGSDIETDDSSGEEQDEHNRPC